MTEKKKNWQLTGSAFAGLLSLLDPDDRNRAGEKYEQLRIRLLRIFDWRGAEMADMLADETLNRIARKIDEGVLIGNIGHFAGGVARNVLREFYDERTRERTKLAADAAETASPSEEDERVPCFRQCLDALPEDQSRVLIDYYNLTDVPRIVRRRQLANDSGETANALRIRVHRLRQQLELCIDGCMES